MLSAGVSPAFSSVLLFDLFVVQKLSNVREGKMKSEHASQRCATNVLNASDHVFEPMFVIRTCSLFFFFVINIKHVWLLCIYISLALTVALTPTTFAAAAVRLGNLMEVWWWVRKG